MGKTFSAGLLGAVMVMAPLAMRAAAPPDRPSFATPGTTSEFQVSENTQIPGKVLKEGSYSITVVDHLSDRMILKVAGDGGGEATTFLALPSRGSGQTPGPIVMGAKKNALKGFVFPDGSVAQFVYPKDEAVALAKANGTTVPAIDPASEGRPAASSLSKDDMQMVTLWMLTPTVVGPSKTAGMEAKRYEASDVPPPPPPPAAAPRRSAPANEVAENTPPPPPPAAAAAKPKKVAHPIGTLPHTASQMPATLLAGVLALMGAATLTTRRRLTGRTSGR